ncbi:nucleotidyltransferase family protein [Sedimenticola hydrogenitrophicus]|uniref:nucleotidyltransferase family protein n=1 Tax=Sedimenticola hydrogenitrophicus TaxID=2967975 RepID=UPI0023B050E9|nr:nucleotidyltransferase family protein [Sedimenticola hydrogenitrophicus]
MPTRLPIKQTELADFCRTHGIQRLSLFGSTLKGTATPQSDIDLLVEFEPGNTPGLLALAEMEAELSELMKGIKVDLRTPNELSHLFRESILSTAEVQYAA